MGRKSIDVFTRAAIAEVQERATYMHRMHNAVAIFTFSSTKWAVCTHTWQSSQVRNKIKQM